MAEQKAQLEAAIAALEAQRALLGDTVVEAVLLSLREKLAAKKVSGVGSGCTSIKSPTGAMIVAKSMGCNRPSAHAEVVTWKGVA